MPTHDRSDTPEEALAALLDGAVQQEELGPLLDRVSRDPALRARWARYHAVRATFEGMPPARLSAGFAERVRGAVAAEPRVLAPARRGRRQAPAARPRPWTPPAAAVALAATLAAVAIGALLVSQGAGERASTPLAGSAAPADSPGETPAALTLRGERADLAGVASAATRERMGVYLASHSEFASAMDLPVVMPHSRLTGFNAGQ